MTFQKQLGMEYIIIPTDELHQFRGVAQPPTRYLCVFENGVMWVKPKNTGKSMRSNFQHKYDQSMGTMINQVHRRVDYSRLGIHVQYLS